MRTLKEFLFLAEKILQLTGPDEPNYSSQSYQDRLKKQKEEKRQKAKKRSNELYTQRVHGRGIRAVSQGKSGWIKNGAFTPDEDS